MSITPRILFVHAHPDDETITTGGTIAAEVAAGAQVTVLTATRGEGGEVIGSELAHLEGDRAGLAAHRETEIAEAMAALGVSDHRFLGTVEGGASGPRPQRRFEDSGMEWGSDGHAVAPATMVPEALCRADLATVAGYIAAVIDEVRPHAVVTYSANGGYGHPDHVRVHEATVAAVNLAQWRIGRFLFVEMPVQVAQAAYDPQQQGFPEAGFNAAETIPALPPAGEVLIAADISKVWEAKRTALQAHGTQVSVSGQFFALSNGVGTRIIEHEFYSVSEMTPVPVEMTVAASHGQLAPGILTGLDLAAGEAAAAGQKRARRAPRKPGVAAYIHAVLLGLLIGFLGAMQHLNASVVHLGGTAIIVPWGLALALLLAVCGLWHLKSMYRSTGPMLIAAFVIAVLSYVLGQPLWLPGSDIVVTGTLRSAVWLIVPMLLAAVFAFIRIPRR